MDEHKLIQYIRQQNKPGRNIIKGIGDDCAVLKYTRDKYLLLTTDMLVCGTHFKAGLKEELIGRKALAVNISDIAACGGTPTVALISVGFPKKSSLSSAIKIYQGLEKCARGFKIKIIGGDTVRADKLVISITLLGEVKKKDLILRSGARVRDIICVTGSLGGSDKGKHYLFEPRLGFSKKIKKLFNPSAMIDLSDGLAQDLSHIAKESNCGAVIYESLIPITRNSSLKSALFYGEDFELLFTSSLKGQLTVAQKKLAQPIGEIVKGKGVVLVRWDGKKEKIDVNKRWKHF